MGTCDFEGGVDLGRQGALTLVGEYDAATPVLGAMAQFYVFAADIIEEDARVVKMLPVVFATPAALPSWTSTPPGTGSVDRGCDAATAKITSAAVSAAA